MLKQNYFINEIILSVLKCEDYEQLKKNILDNPLYF
jgi:hypothetical protein